MFFVIALFSVINIYLKLCVFKLLSDKNRNKIKHTIFLIIKKYHQIVDKKRYEKNEEFYSIILDIKL